jgi:hypothetical protein
LRLLLFLQLGVERFFLEIQVRLVAGWIDEGVRALS